MEELETPPSSVFVGSGYVQNRGSCCHGSHCVRYSTYLTHGNHGLSDAIAFSYGGGINAGSRMVALSVNDVGSSKDSVVFLDNSEA